MRKFRRRSTFAPLGLVYTVMKDAAQDEYALAVRARDGDLAALAALVERLRLRLFAIAYADLRHYEDAQDAVASALVRICLYIGSLRDATQHRAWMHAVVKNEARRLLERRSADSAHVRMEDIAEWPAPLEESHLRLDVQEALRRLPADQARAMALFYLGNRSIREIARSTNRPEGTVKSWLHYGRQNLAHAMKEYAPMTPTEWTAAIVSTDLPSEVVNSLADALRAAGYSRVNLFDDYRKVLSADPFRILESGLGATEKFHLPDPLKGTHLVVLDERIGGLSAFEIHLILRAAAKEDNIVMENADYPGIPHCILLDPPDPNDEEITRMHVFAAWVAGFDLCFNKPVQPDVLTNLARKCRESMQGEGGSANSGK